MSLNTLPPAPRYNVERAQLAQEAAGAFVSLIGHICQDSAQRSVIKVL
jgi:hypothetical protein